MTRLARLARTWSGQSSDTVTELLADQVRTAIEGVRLARLLVSEGGDTGLARGAMSRVEHQGDDCRASLVAALGGVLVSPLDREDLFRVSRSVDDVLDTMRDFVRQWGLFQMSPCGRYADLFDTVLEGLVALEEAVQLSRRPTAKMTDATMRARKAANRVRHELGEALAELLVGEVDMAVLRARELLRRVELVGVRLTEAADALTDAAVKRSVL